jgi:hypothetical protein
MPSCFSCGAQQPKRRLRPIELSSAGDVLVCRDTHACHDRARIGLRVPARAPQARGGRPKPRRRPGRLVLVLAVALVGAFVLPHFTIDGRHWHVWMLP